MLRRVTISSDARIFYSQPIFSSNNNKASDNSQFSNNAQACDNFQFSNNAQACDMPNGTINATFNANCADIYNKSKVASDGKIIIFDLASNQGEELMYK